MKHINARLIETTYDYQKEIARKACLHNSIICLVTGLGKTFIIEDFVKKRKKGERIFVIAPSAFLVIQFKSVLNMQLHGSLKVGDFFRSRPTCSVDALVRLVECDMWIFTPQLLVEGYLRPLSTAVSLVAILEWSWSMNGITVHVETIRWEGCGSLACKVSSSHDRSHSHSCIGEPCW